MIRFLPFMLLGCAESAKDVPTISGTIGLSEDGYSGEVEWDRAFMYQADGRMIAFITGVEDASCGKATEFLEGVDGPLDKSGILEGGGCVMTVLIEDWDNGFYATWPDDDASYSPAVNSNIRCDLGDGEFVLETRGGEYEDYFWSGLTWAGLPTVFKWDFGPDTLEMKMSSYQGSLPYEADMSTVYGSGLIEGAVNTERCDGLSAAAIF